MNAYVRSAKPSQDFLPGATNFPQWALMRHHAMSVEARFDMLVHVWNAIGNTLEQPSNGEIDGVWY